MQNQGDPTIFVGQCSRPADEPCLSKNPLECCVHAPALLANEDDQADEAKSVRRQIARARERAMHGERRGARQRIAHLEQLLGPGSEHELKAEIARERLRFLSPGLQRMTGPASSGAGPVPHQFTVIRRGKASFDFGSVSVSTPSSTRAVIAS